MNDSDKKLIVQVFVSAAVLFLVYLLLQKLGLFDTMSERRIVKQGKKSKNSTKELEKTQGKNKKGEYQGFSDDTDEGGSKTVIAIAKDIEDSKHWYGNNDGKAISALKRIQNRTQLQEVVLAFNKLFKEDLFVYLHFLNDADAKVANDYINKL